MIAKTALEQLARHVPSSWQNAAQFAPRFVSAALVLALTVQGIGIGLNLKRALAPPPPHDARPAAAGRDRGIDVPLIVGQHLFGSPPISEDSANAGPTAATLVLTGVIAADEPHAGRAILGETATSAKLFAVGDSVPRGARLHSVYADHVLLEVDGRLELLKLPTAESAAVLARGPSGSRSPTVALAQMAPSESVPATGAAGAMLVDVMHALPVSNGGHLQGYRLSPGRLGAEFQRLGLHAGDILTAVDDAPLDTFGHAFQILRATSASSRPRLTVIHDGVVQTMVLGASGNSPGSD